MTAFIIKVYKNGKLHHQGKGIARSSWELMDSAMVRYFPCKVHVRRVELKPPKKEECYV